MSGTGRPSAGSGGARRRWSRAGGYRGAARRRARRSGRSPRLPLLRRCVRDTTAPPHRSPARRGRARGHRHRLPGTAPPPPCHQLVAVRVVEGVCTTFCLAVRPSSRPGNHGRPANVCGRMATATVFWEILPGKNSPQRTPHRERQGQDRRICRES